MKIKIYLQKDGQNVELSSLPKDQAQSIVSSVISGAAKSIGLEAKRKEKENRL